MTKSFHFGKNSVTFYGATFAEIEEKKERYLKANGIILEIPEIKKDETEKPVKTRNRRTKAEIEAEELAKASMFDADKEE